MNVISIVGTCIVTAMFSLLLKQYKPEFSLAVSVLGTVFIFSLILFQMIPLFSTVRSIMTRSNFSYGYVKIILKALGISYVAETGTEICRESGHLALASKVELAGKTAILIIAIPMFEELLKLSLDLIHL